MTVPLSPTQTPGATADMSQTEARSRQPRGGALGWQNFVSRAEYGRGRDFSAGGSLSVAEGSLRTVNERRQVVTKSDSGRQAGGDPVYMS